VSEFLHFVCVFVTEHLQVSLDATENCTWLGLGVGVGLGVKVRVRVRVRVKHLVLRRSHRRWLAAT
jgi:hypothetical protein